MDEDRPYGVRLIVAYDGTGFAGWQRQSGGVRTVQATVDEAVHRVTIHHSGVRGASRTDAGVHALGQVAAFDCDRELPAKAWMHELNQRLPQDVSVQHAEPCEPGYDPRFDATGKLYRYMARIGRWQDPLTRNRAWQIGPPLSRPGSRTRDAFPAVHDYLDVEAMSRAAEQLVGRHDFRAFQGRYDYRDNTVRTLRSVRVRVGLEARDDLLAIEVEGDAFLKHMVRILAGTLIDVGRGQMRPEDMPALLEPGVGRAAAGQTAPAHGLTLVRVHLGRRQAVFRETRIRPGADRN